MSEKKDNDKENFLIKQYRCNFCNAMHDVRIKKSLLDAQTKYPFPYVFLHNTIKNGEAKELITILYIDRDGKVRGSEIQEFSTNDLFSKEQVMAIVEPLIKEIRILQQDNIKLKKQIQELQ